MPLAATVRVWSAPLTLAAFALFAVEIVWFAANFATRTGPPIIGTAPVILGSAVAALAMRRAWRAPGMTVAAARFWRTMTLASTAIVVAQLTDVPGYLVTPSTQPNPVSLGVYGVTMIAVVTAFYRLPLDSRGAGGRTRLLLDCATVTVAALLIIWYAALTRMSSGDASKLLATTAVASVGLGLVVLALAKVVFSGGRTIDLLALRALGFGLALQMVGVFVTPLILDRPQIAGEPLGRSAMYILVAAAAGYQIRAAGLPEVERRKSKERVFSILPYLAVAVVDAFLLYAIRGQDGATVVIGGGAVALTVLVVVRQLAAFRENGRLIAEIRSYHDQLAYQATHDSLTGLANRALFAGELEAAVADPGRHGCWLALVDLDGFKAVNDTFGHHTGDGLLVEVADRLRAGVRPGDLVARLGGDEFAVLLRGLPDADVDEVLGRMLGTLQKPLAVDGHDIAVRASVGIVDAASEDDPATLMRHADTAMYEAKRSGKGRFARYRDDRAATAERQPSR